MPREGDSKAMDSKQLVVLALQISIIAIVFGFGLKATPNDLLYLLRRPGLLARSLLAVFVIMPIITVLLARTFDFLPTVEIALIALSISPLPPLLPRKEGKAGGVGSYGLGLMATLALLSILIVPAAVQILAYISGRSFEIAPSAVGNLMLKMVLGPLAAGMAARALVPALAARIAGPVNTLALILAALGLLPLLVVALPAMWGLVGDGTIVAMAIFALAGLAVGHFLGGPEPEEAVVLALSTASRHPAIALSIAAAAVPEERFGATILLYIIVTAIVAIPYIRWRKSKVAQRAA
jgi:BASS family bile acid:Na+ symporter